jgi:hypothetical protein
MRQNQLGAVILAASTAAVTVTGAARAGNRVVSGNPGTVWAYGVDTLNCWGTHWFGHGYVWNTCPQWNSLVIPLTTWLSNPPGYMVNFEAWAYGRSYSGSVTVPYVSCRVISRSWNGLTVSYSDVKATLGSTVNHQVLPFGQVYQQGTYHLYCDATQGGQIGSVHWWD